MSRQLQITPSKKLARQTGILYLAVIILAGFSQGYVRGSIFLPDQAQLTAEHILANEGLFRLGFATDLTAFLLDALISVLLYQLFKSTNKPLALISSALRLLAHPAIASLNLLNHFLALEVLQSPDMLSHFSLDQLQSMAYLLLEAHRYGYLIAGVFFGLHCALLGVLIYQSGLIPKVFGLLMIGAAIGYLLESYGNFLFPGNETGLALIVGISAAIGEVTLTLFLLIKGLRPKEK